MSEFIHSFKNDLADYLAKEFNLDSAKVYKEIDYFMLKSNAYKDLVDINEVEIKDLDISGHVRVKWKGETVAEASI